MAVEKDLIEMKKPHNCLVCHASLGEPDPESVRCTKCGQPCAPACLRSDVAGMHEGQAVKVNMVSACCRADVDVSSTAHSTCSSFCHEMLVGYMERRFGKHKRVIDLETGRAHRVPTRDVIERGVRQQDLKSYPFWESDKM